MQWFTVADKVSFCFINGALSSVLAATVTSAYSRLYLDVTAASTPSTVVDRDRKCANTGFNGLKNLALPDFSV